MTMQENVCEVCEIEYRYDDEASPKFRTLVYSQGCWEEYKKKHKKLEPITILDVKKNQLLMVI